MASSSQRPPVSTLAPQTSIGYDVNCNTPGAIMKVITNYLKHANSKLSAVDLQTKTPMTIDLLASVNVIVAGEKKPQNKFMVISTLHHASLQEDLLALYEQKGKTQSLRQCDLSFLTAVYNRVDNQIHFILPTIILNPEVVAPKNDETTSVKKGAVEVSQLKWSEFYILPPKVAAQVIISLYIHNNPSDEPKNSLRASPLFNDFKAAWQLSDVDPENKEDTKVIQIKPGCYFPRFPSCFLNPGGLKDITVRASDYINKPGEAPKKAAGEASKKRTSRSAKSSEDEEEVVAEMDTADHDTLAYIDTNDGFDVTPASRKKKNPPPSKTSVATKKKQTLPPPSNITLEDDGDDTESSSAPKPAKKRQATPSKKSSEPVGEKRVSASLIAGSLTVNEITEKILDDTFKDVPSVCPPSDSLASYSDALVKIQACAKMPEDNETAENLVSGFGKEVRKIMESTLEIFGGFKSGEVVRRALAGILTQKLSEISEESLKATDASWVDNEDLVAPAPKTRIHDIKSRLGIPDDVHLPLGTYATLFGLLRDSDPALKGHATAGASMMARPKTAGLQSVFVPTTPSQIPKNEASSNYAFMLFQGAENTNLLVDLLTECFTDTSDNFVPELESVLSTVENLEKETAEVINK